ncbi:MBL fold metallo-hydrolase [Pontibacter sp. G13]|uniref:MBL fold metallo-hydrolase n=1 Tax=Pontibacter sp. G13 TaxID=3074898 RepID=UPI00288A6ECA|nr:MBL fold metallo-hydrolase [Pontibacter sp. G13]WNJ21580.1 MBL fold metallo-hydrolase [Pontibacter sp. G13]
MSNLVKTLDSCYIEQIYTGCLAEAAYYIESDGEAAIIDPMREIEPYLELANARGATIKYVFETHFHADFVSGHVDLARRTGAQIIYGPKAETAFEATIATDRQIFHLGRISFEVLHTPGHTPESSCYLLRDESAEPHAVFTGDTLFVGSVGRPDLAVKSDLTQEDLAGMLYDSLRNQLMPLPDHVLVCPAHGAGSACGKGMSQERYSTIGQQKLLNTALHPQSREEFISEITDGIMPPPQYFPKNAQINKQGYREIDQVVEQGTIPMSIDQVEAAIQDGALLLDTRKAADFCRGHIPGSMFVGLDGSFATWVGTLIEDLGQPIVLITDPGREAEAVIRLARVGYNQALGYVEGGVQQWKAHRGDLSELKSISTETYASLKKTSQIHSVDVRKPSEYRDGHVKGATGYPLDFFNQQENPLESGQSHYLYCRSGYRSVVAASLLMRQGYDGLVNVEGGFNAISQTDVPTE